MQCWWVAVRASVLGGVAVPARGAAAGVGGRTRRTAARARARLPRHPAHAGPGQRARCYEHPAYKESAYTPQVIITAGLHSYYVSFSRWWPYPHQGLLMPRRLEWRWPSSPDLI